MGNTESMHSDMEDEHQQNRQQHQNNNNTSVRSLPMDADNDADPWWWEVENADLILDHIPHVTSVYSDDNGSNKDNDNITSIPSKSQDNVNTSLTSFVNYDENPIVEERKNCDLTSDPSNCEPTEKCLTENNMVVPQNKAREQTLEEFKEELRIKRLARKTAVQDLRDEIASLQKKLINEQALTCRLRKSIEESLPVKAGETTLMDEENTVNAEGNVPLLDDVATTGDADDSNSRSRYVSIELANIQLQLQMANSENISLCSELNAVRKQVGTLKEVISCCKQMLVIKEDQCTQLKNKLTEIENSFAEREMDMMSDNLRVEYERQLNNIKQLRQLYEERQRVSAAEHENLQRLLAIKRDEVLAEKEKTRDLTEKNNTLILENQKIEAESLNLQQECNELKSENDTLKEEMHTINTLFSQMIMGFNGKNNINIDHLVEMLEENRGLLNDMAMKEVHCGDGATLPKLLFELFEQASIFAETVEVKTASRRCKMSPAAIKAVSLSRNEKQLTDATDNIAAEYVVEDDDGDQEEIEEDAVHDEVDADKATTSEFFTQSDDNKGNIISCNRQGNADNNNKHTNNISRKATKSSKASQSSEMPGKMVTEITEKVASAEEIIANLPKVWKVIMELLSHHTTTTQVQLSSDNEQLGENNGDCYKSVQTPNGPKAEISVSKTYIKLKDLILEKKSLVKETNRLKTLNSHLEFRLNEQEKRLSAVSLELGKTWHLVGKMQRQHRQLHTQEQILRYQLQQKRRLLSELKDELQHCRRKWTAARAKNDESQVQCNDLRQEFAKRKLEDANQQSVESGYSDGASASEDDVLSATEMPASDKERNIAAGCSRHQHFRELFEHSRQIKRMKSTSPGRAVLAAVPVVTNIVLRCSSAPPTCGWWSREWVTQYDTPERTTATAMNEAGVATDVICKERNSRERTRVHQLADSNVDTDSDATKSSCDNKDNAEDNDAEPPTQETEACSSRATRIQRLEEQCKSLIQQVLETSDNRERLEVQLSQFQRGLAAGKYTLPLNDASVQRMARASSAPATAGVLTAREEEYTRKRSERLERLEEESRQLMSRIKRTTDRGHYLGCSLDRIRRAPSNELDGASNEAPLANETVMKCIETEEVAEEEEVGRGLVEDETIVNSNDNTLAANVLLTSRNTDARSQQPELDSQRNEHLDTLGAVSLATDNFNDENESELTTEQRIECMKSISSNREQRLQLMKEEGDQLLARLSNTLERGTQMVNRIAKRKLNHDESKSGLSNAAAAEREHSGHRIASEMLPTLQNIASTSIVAEELQPHATVTTTASQVGRERQGAVPKIQMTTKKESTEKSRGQMPQCQSVVQLSAVARSKLNKCTPNSNTSNNNNEMKIETLEEMVRRLQTLPFPDDEHKQNENENQNQKN